MFLRDCCRMPWSSKESKVVLTNFKIAIKYKMLPGKEECEKLIQSNPDLFQNRKWSDIKFFVKIYLHGLDCLQK